MCYTTPSALVNLSPIFKHFTLLCSTALYHTLLYDTRLYSTLRYPTQCYATLSYFTYAILPCYHAERSHEITDACAKQYSLPDCLFVNILREIPSFIRVNMDSERPDEGKGRNISEASRRVPNDVFTDWNAWLWKEKETVVPAQKRARSKGETGRQWKNNHRHSQERCAWKPAWEEKRAKGWQRTTKHMGHYYPSWKGRSINPNGC